MIRKATEKDIPEIKKLMQAESRFWQKSWRSDVLQRALKSAGDLAFVCEQSGKILGFVCAHDFGFRAYLSELIVDKSARDQGFGKKLIQHVEHELTSRGCLILISDVWKDTQEFYRCLGFSEPDVVLMRKRLGTDSSQPKV